ncbi:hypothetical protein QQ045_017458 [Rhodiola kirilowii]
MFIRSIYFCKLPSGSMDCNCCRLECSDGLTKKIDFRNSYLLEIYATFGSLPKMAAIRVDALLLTNSNALLCGYSQTSMTSRDNTLCNSVKGLPEFKCYAASHAISTQLEAALRALQHNGQRYSTSVEICGSLREADEMPNIYVDIESPDLESWPKGIMRATCKEAIRSIVLVCASSDIDFIFKQRDY